MNNCQLCNKPCILIRGKCLIAAARKATGLPFKTVWNSITSTGYTYQKDNEDIQIAINKAFTIADEPKTIYEHGRHE